MDQSVYSASFIRLYTKPRRVFVNSSFFKTHFLVSCHSFVPLSFCPVSRSAPDASPRVVLSPPVFYRAGTVWPLSCKMAAHGALS